MDDDFNAANGITVLYELIRWTNIYLEGTPTKVILRHLRDLIIELSDIFGITFKQTFIDSDIEKLIEERKMARTNKYFQRADEIRNILKSEGIELLDTPDGTRFKRTEV